MNEHWLEKARREKRLYNLNGHTNKPRMSAATILKLVHLRNKLTGGNMSVLEASQKSEERINEPI